MADLKQLNDFLSTRPFVGSESSATEEDFKLDASITADKAKFPHVLRWSQHLGRLKLMFPYRQWPAGTKFGAVAGAAKEVQADSKVTKASPKAAAAAEVKKTEDKPKEKKQEKPAAAAKPAATGGAARDDDDDAAAKISLIVGKVTKVWEHPDSDKLFCEEIDCGEAEVRQIGSGLRHFYKAEEFEGRMVLVVANLKPKKLAGFPSNGMVLCASSADHTDVKFVEVPAGAKIGERVVFGDLEMDTPAEPNPCEKKKLFIKAQPHFNAKGGVAMYKDKPFTLSSGVCTAPVADGYSLS